MSWSPSFTYFIFLNVQLDLFLRPYAPTLMSLYFSSLVHLRTYILKFGFRYSTAQPCAT